MRLPRKILSRAWRRGDFWSGLSLDSEGIVSEAGRTAQDTTRRRVTKQAARGEPACALLMKDGGARRGFENTRVN